MKNISHMLSTKDIKILRLIIREEVRPIIRKEVRPIVKQEIQAEVKEIHNELKKHLGYILHIQTTVDGIQESMGEMHQMIRENAQRIQKNQKSIQHLQAQMNNHITMYSITTRYFDREILDIKNKVA